MQVLHIYIGLGPWVVACLHYAGFTHAGEPLSPMSAAKERCEHYTVKEPKIPGGYLCLLCGIGGDIRAIRSKLCTPSPSPAKAKPPPSECHEIPAPTHEMMSAEDQARYLQELAQEEASLTEMLTLQQLQMEEALLESLMLQQRAANLACKASENARVPSLAPESKPAAESVIPAPEPVEVEEAKPGNIILPSPIEKCAPPPDPVTLANLPYGVLACNRVVCAEQHMYKVYTR